LLQHAYCLLQHNVNTSHPVMTTQNPIPKTEAQNIYYLHHLPFYITPQSKSPTCLHHYRSTSPTGIITYRSTSPTVLHHLTIYITYRSTSIPVYKHLPVYITYQSASPTGLHYKSTFCFKAILISNPHCTATCNKICKTEISNLRKRDFVSLLCFITSIFA
jgi:hypothetical protein